MTTPPPLTPQPTSTLGAEVRTGAVADDSPTSTSTASDLLRDLLALCAGGRTVLSGSEVIDVVLDIRIATTRMYDADVITGLLDLWLSTYGCRGTLHAADVVDWALDLSNEFRRLI